MSWAKAIAKTERSPGVALVTLLFSAVVGATVTFGLELVVQVVPENFAIESLASIFVAVATLFLAYQTWKSVKQTKSVVENENKNHRERIENENNGRRLDSTISVVNQFFHTLVPLTNEISLTAYNAESQLVTFSKIPGELSALRASYDAGAHAMDPAARKQYQVVVLACHIIPNFFMLNYQMLQQELLDRSLYLATFAKPFLTVYGPLRLVNDVVGAVSDQRIAALSAFKVECETYLLERGG